jgi:hypothetical protein
MILTYFCYRLAIKISAFRKPFSKTWKFENPSKTIVFPMYFEGRALKHQVTIYPKIEKYIVSKSTIKNE